MGPKGTGSEPEVECKGSTSAGRLHPAILFSKIDRFIQGVLFQVVILERVPIMNHLSIASLQEEPF